MLTHKMLRYRVTGNTITPIYLTTTGGRKYLRLAETILACCREGAGGRIGPVRERLAGIPVEPSDLVVLRGLVKTAEGYLDIEAPVVDAAALRREVFTQAASRACGRCQPLAPDDLAKIAGRHGIAPDAVMSHLYADLRERQILRAVDPDITATMLIHRYNTALAQAMLYRAVKLAVDVEDNYRMVFQYIKLAGLMHTIRRQGAGYRIFLDGPLSLFTQVERYGFVMARFLPAILHGRQWRLEALINTGKGEKRFILTPADGLVSHYREEPVFNSALEEAFHHRFNRGKRRGWTATREGAILDLGDTVLIPDFTFTHEDGRVVHLEIAGFWTPEYLQRKFAKLRRLDARNLILAIPETRNCAHEEFAGPVIRFKSRLLLRDLLPALEACGS